MEEPRVPKITKRAVDALRPDRNGKDIIHWDAGDGALKGFGVRLNRVAPPPIWFSTAIRKGARAAS